MSETTTTRSVPEHLTAPALEKWIAAKVAEEVEAPLSKIDVNAQLNRLGLDSAQAVVLSGELSRHVGFKLSVALIWDYPTITSLAAHVAALAAARSAP